MAGSLQEVLEARAIKAGTMPVAVVAGTNAAPTMALGMVPATYAVPRDDLNAAGWTNTDTGKVFITQGSAVPRANLVAHEAFHARQVPAGGMPDPTTQPQIGARAALSLNMRELQPPARKAGPHWGLDPNSSAEEQIANLRGYEGALPAGTPITASPIAERLFQPNILDPASRQDMIDYYFNRSSLPYKGVWEGQVPAPGMFEQLVALARKVAVSRLGMNMPAPAPLEPPATPEPKR